MENNQVLCLVAGKENTKEKGFAYMPQPPRTSQVEIECEGNNEKKEKENA